MRPPSFYVVSHERAGTHFAINSLLKNTVGIDAQANVGEWFGPYDDPGARFEHIDLACRSIRPVGTLIKSHCDADLFAARYPVRPVLWVVRDPRDTLVSWFHYLNHDAFYANNPQVERFQGGSFGEFLRRPLTDFLRCSYSLHGDFENVAERWAAHTLGWVHRLGPGVCVLRYEELLTDFEPTLRRAADFLHLMLRPTLEPVAFGEGLTHLARKGVIGDWKNEATPEDLRWLDGIVRRHGLAEFYHSPTVQKLSIPSPPPMSPTLPTRLLFLRPDAYGDLVLFEPVLRLARETWPQAEIAVLIRKAHEDIAPLLGDGVRWLTTDCNPYREDPGDRPAALDGLRRTVCEFAPDWVVAACAEQTWLESAVAAFLPAAHQVSLGLGLTDPVGRAALGAVLPVDWAAIYPRKIPAQPGLGEWEQNLGLASALIGREAPRWWPVVQVPATARAQASRIVADAGLTAGEFVVCAAAGTANVPIKSWPAESYGETLAWLEKEHGVRALLIGHVSEREPLETAQRAAREHGGQPALWLGRDGEMPVVAGLLDAARFYFGNDTGALHLAAALGRPVVPVFGGGTWPRFQPVAARARTVVQPLPCFGCGWECYFVDAPCVRTISTASVRRALQQLLDGPADGQVIVEADGLDAGARALIETATPHLRFLREDSTDRLRQVTELTLQTHGLAARLQSSDADRDARQIQVEELTALLKTSETDCAARQIQVEELTTLLQASEIDRDARRTQVQELTALLTRSEADRDARQLQVEELHALLGTSESDRDARQIQVEQLQGLLTTSEADRDARLRQVQELTALLKTSDADRHARQLQVEELTALLKTSEEDRHARQLQIEELAALLKTSEADRAARLQQVNELTALLRVSEADRAARGSALTELAAHIAKIEAELEYEHANAHVRDQASAAHF